MTLHLYTLFFFFFFNLWGKPVQPFWEKADIWQYNMAVRSWKHQGEYAK